AVAQISILVLTALTLLLLVDSAFTRHPGEYVSAEIRLNSSSGLVVASPSATGGIIHAQDLGLVNSTNLGTYAVPYNSSAAGSDIYSALLGDYYYVAFSAAQPATTIVATPAHGSLASYGLLVLAGIVLAIAGFVVVVVGALQKSRPRDDMAQPA
ncbi:MAG: hypothetical protein JRN24_03610, partial [Nitrososphaerota archaeon]|nr:hypothetical protein [Nitrososphaerota archaeon]